MQRAQACVQWVVQRTMLEATDGVNGIDDVKNGDGLGRARKGESTVASTG